MTKAEEAYVIQCQQNMQVFGLPTWLLIKFRPAVTELVAAAGGGEAVKRVRPAQMTAFLVRRDDVWWRDEALPALRAFTEELGERLRALEAGPEAPVARSVPAKRRRLSDGRSEAATGDATSADGFLVLGGADHTAARAGPATASTAPPPVFPWLAKRERNDAGARLGGPDEDDDAIVDPDGGGGVGADDFFPPTPEWMGAGGGGGK